jgi:hypothetical protein
MIARGRKATRRVLRHGGRGHPDESHGVSTMSGLTKVEGGRLLAGALFLTVALPTSAAAQVGDLLKRVGVGMSAGPVIPVDDEVDVGLGWGFTFALTPKPGWGWAGNLAWFTGDLLLKTSSGDQDVGSVQVRPLLGGVGYTWMKGRMATSATLTAGVSFNSADIDDRYRDIFGPGTRVELEMDNSFAVRPSVEVEYAIIPKVAVTGTAAFFFTKIDSRLVTPAATYDDQWNASSFLLSAGVLIYPFQ